MPGDRSTGIPTKHYRYAGRPRDRPRQQVYSPILNGSVFDATRAAGWFPATPPVDPFIHGPNPTGASGPCAADKIAFFRLLFGGRTDVFPTSRGDRHDRQDWLCARLRQQVGARCLRQETGQMRGLPKSEIHSRIVGRHRVLSERRGLRSAEWPQWTVRCRRLTERILQSVAKPCMLVPTRWWRRLGLQ